MTCERCHGFLYTDPEETRCLSCGHRPYEPRIIEKCADVDCRKVPEIRGYCTQHWFARKRSALTDQERSARYRTRMRNKQRARRAKQKQEAHASETRSPGTVEPGRAESFRSCG